MNVCIYRAKGKNGYIYDMSMNPSVDFNVLKKTRDIKGIEIIANEVELSKATLILKDIYGIPSMIGMLIKSEDSVIRGVFKRYRIKQIKKVENFQLTPLSLDKMEIIEGIIVGRVISIKRLIKITTQMGYGENEVLDIIQALYCERRIKILPQIIGRRGKRICTICKCEECDVCCMGFSEDDVLIYAADNYSLEEPKIIEVVKPNLSDVLKDSEKKLKSFLKSRKKIGILWCAPNAFKEAILFESISDIVKRGGRVLYITSTFSLQRVKEEFKNSIIGSKVEVTDGVNYSYRNLDITICSYTNYPCFHKAFDLVILDTLYSFIERPPRNIEVIASRGAKERGKFINITNIIEGKGIGSLGQMDIIHIPTMEIKRPIPEPKCIISRFLKDGEAFIPPLAADVIIWSLNRGIKVLIFVPNEEAVQRVFYYLIRELSVDEDLIDVSYENEKSPMLKFIKNQISVLISVDVRDAVHTMTDVNVIVMYSDDDAFRGDTLVNMAAVAVQPKGERFDTREVLFVASGENNSMYQARMAIRELNKVGWEEGYLKR